MIDRIAILTAEPFPIGNVATNRFTTYAKAFVKKGIFTKIFILKATEIKGHILNPNTNGEFNGVKYQYMSNTTIWNTKSSLLFKIYHYISGIIIASIIIKKENYHSIILYSNDPIYMLYFGFYSKIFNIKYYADKSEYPKVYFSKKSLYKKFYLKLFKLFDGIIVMTKELEDYYTKFTREKSLCFYLPMTVDFERFQNIRKKYTNPQYICCVFGSHGRDCILDTIKAFYRFKKMNPSDIQLILIGDLDRLTDKAIILDYINHDASEISSDIIFQGIVDTNLIPQLLSDASCLITTPRGYVSGGFPSKLGEYLATGNPVLANDAGEISLYLKHKINVFLSQPGDIQQIAENLYFVFNNITEAKYIGENGRKITTEIFDANNYIDELINFMN